MDPVTQTLFTMFLMFIATLVGKRIGRQEGITATVPKTCQMRMIISNE
jgi:hypothetical protein